MNAPLRFWIAILAIGILGLALRLYFAGEPLWLDELHTAWCVDVDSGLSDVSSRASQGNQAPLFFLLTKLVTSALAPTPLVLRLISITCGIVAIFGSAVFVYRLNSNIWSAALTALLVSLDQWLLFYSSEARPYAMIQLVAMLQFMTFLSLVVQPETESSRARWLRHSFLKVFTFLLLTTHLTGGLLVLTEMILLVAIRPKPMIPILFSLIAGSAIVIPLVWFAFDVFNHRNQWQSDSSWQALFVDWRGVLMLQLAPAALVTICSLFRKTSKKDEPDSKATTTAWYLLAWAVIPLALAAILDRCSIPLASYRYTTVASLAPPVCAGLVVALLPTRTLMISFLLLMAIVNVAANPVVQAVVVDKQLPTFRNENWQSAVELVNEFQGGPNLVFLMSNLYEDSRAGEDRSDEFQHYLLFPVSSIYSLDERFEIIPIPTRHAEVLNSEQIEKCTANQGAIFICRVTNERLQQIKSELETTFMNRKLDVQIETMQQPGNLLKVVVLEMEE